MRSEATCGILLVCICAVSQRILPRQDQPRSNTQATPLNVKSSAKVVSSLITRPCALKHAGQYSSCGYQCSYGELRSFHPRSSSTCAVPLVVPTPVSFALATNPHTVSREDAFGAA